MNPLTRGAVGIVVAMVLVTAGCDWLGSVKDKAEAVVSRKPVHSVETVSFDADTYPAVVLGGGMGGMTASIYLSMANIRTRLSQGKMPGGLLTQSLSVRNWPGEIDAPGAAITEKLQAQAIRRGVEVKSEVVTSVDLDQWPYRITVADVHDETKTRMIKALTVIIGMGASSNYLGIPGEQEYWSKGVTNCAVCEGSLYRDKTVCVVGGGDSAMEEASYLAGLAKKVYIFVRRDTLRAVDNRKDEVLELPNVEVVYNTSLLEVEGDGKKATGVRTINNKTKEEGRVALDGVFLAIGFTPNTQLFKDQLTLTDRGYISLFEDQETSVPGVYAVGDIVDPQYKQAVTAAGDGCRAALQAHAYLNEIGYKPQAASTTREAKPAAESALAQMAEPVAVKERAEVTDEAVQAEHGASYEPGVVHEITSVEAYDQLMASAQTPVIVDFYATWCGPCKQIAPLYKKIAAAYGERATFIKVNIDTVPDLGRQASIQGVPTFIFTAQGDEKGRLVGGHHTRKQFEEKIDGLIKTAA